MLYKLEVEMGKTLVEVKAIIDSKWKKCLKELNGVRDATQVDVDTNIAIWEVIARINHQGTIIERLMSQLEEEETKQREKERGAMGS